MAKIIGNTTTTPMTVPDLAQTDERKADYIKNKKISFLENDIGYAEKTYVDGKIGEIDEALNEIIASGIEDIYSTADDTGRQMVVIVILKDGRQLSFGVPYGEEGYTPVKGTDYWTEEDKAEVKGYVTTTMMPVEVVSCEVTQEAIDAAGEEGITVVTAGNEDVDISGYNEIIISVTVPISNTLNTENGQIMLQMTSGEGSVVTGADNFLVPQSTNIATNSSITPDRNNIFTVTGLWSGEFFLYGMVIRNGYGSSFGYPGVANGWNSIAPEFDKNMKKYFHLRSRGGTFKFPAGTKMTVYGR